MSYIFALDATSIPNKPTGIGNYTLGLIRSLSQKIINDRLIIFGRHDQNKTFGNLNATFIDCGNLNTPKRLIWEQIQLPLLLKKHSIDLLHSPNYTLPSCAKCKRIVTIHDLTSFIFPNRRKLIHGWFFRQMIRLSIKKADMIISVSENTRKDIYTIFKRQENVQTVYQGFNSQFTNIESKSFIYNGKMAIKNPYFLFVSTIEPSKNVERLIRSFLQFNKQNNFTHNLYLVGKLGWSYNKIIEMINSSETKANVKYLGYQTNEQLFYLYRYAQAFIYPSLYEGFGIPPLEAMACNVPTLCSNTSSLPEVVGDAALTFDPYNEQELIDAMKKISHDTILRKDLIEKGRQRCKQFSWDKTAEEILKFYYKLVE